ncbi:MAG: hypothetical protein IT347_07590 [Candidatus Eisenbacteria bacterium]|nr:hypothetical protein [Candidatus Eisenbacteria bacterium]
MSVRPGILGAFLLVALLPAVAVGAPLGRSFTYQGQLSEADSLVTGTVHLRFSLWDAAGAGDPPTGGTQIGTSQVVSNITVNGGLFSAQVNAGDEFGATAFNGEARWLQIELCADGTCTSATPLGPRQAMTATPYSLGPWQLNGTNLSYTGGNVGVGTAAPAALIHARSTGPAMILQDDASEANQTGFVGFSNSLSAQTGWMGFGNTGSPNLSIFNSRSNGAVLVYTLGTERLRISPIGNVGIGTSTPAARLDVRGSIKVGSAGEYFVPGAEIDLKIVRGVVSSSGFRLFGLGFASTRTGTGVYSITFDTPFVDQPSITATCQHPSLDRIAIISSHFAGSCTIRVVSGSGTPVDCTFDLIAIGRR